VIIENFDTVVDKTGFLDMSAENLLEIIKYDDIQVQIHCGDTCVYTKLIFIHVQRDL